MPDRDDTAARRTWGQRGLIAMLTVAVLAAATTAGSLAYANSRVSEITRVDLSGELSDEMVEPGDPMNILIVGIDDASALADDDPAKAFRDSPDVAGQHTDSIMILRLDPREATAQLLSFPRDLWLPIADTDTDQRINTAFQTGGPRRLIRTIDQNFGIPIHNFVSVDFAGFGELVDIVDGVPIEFPRPVRDRRSGLAIEQAGCYTLGPRQALAFARSRYFEAQDVVGDWYEDPRSDFSRIGRQQLFIELALSRAIAKGARNPNTLRRLVDLGASAVTFDDSFEIGSLVDIGVQYRSFRPADLQRYELTVVDDLQGGAKVLTLVEEASEPTLAVFRGAPPADPSATRAEDVTVQVLNGTGTQGQGGETTEELAALGFPTLATADADVRGGPTTVRYVPGGEAAAQVLARAVAGPVAYERADGLGGADAVLITGSDWQGVAPMLRSVQDVTPPAGDDGVGTSSSTDATTEGTATEPDGPTGDTTDETADDTADEGATTDPADAPTTTTTPADSDDPSDPGFFLARSPGDGADCPRTD